MSFGQDCVRGGIVQSLCVGGLLGMLCAWLVVALLKYLADHDEEFRLSLSCRSCLLLYGLGMCMGGFVLWRKNGNTVDIAVGLLMLIYLMLCSVTDRYMQQIYDVFQLYVCISLAMLQFCRELPSAIGVELIIFAVAQGWVFRRMYGEGDVMGFLICALSLVEKGVYIWILHMGITYILLGLVQGMRRNIGKDGNLKIPVALFPYIAIAYMFVF